MISLWNDEEAARCAGELELRVYSSRLLGRDKSLVLHGGGNTSLKLKQRDLFGDEREVLYIKGSGEDLARVQASAFVPLDLALLRRLTQQDRLSDADLVNALATHKLVAAAPEPSVETLLHAILPHKYVDHTHADAVLAVACTRTGAQRMREIYGDTVVVVPYAMPGFSLARLCAAEFPRQARPATMGMILMGHGVFSFGDTAKQAYERMLAIVQGAEEYLRTRGAWMPVHADATPGRFARSEHARLRKDWSQAAGAPLVLTTDTSAATLNFARRTDLAALVNQGPPTPDHIIRTKRVPMLGKNIQAYASDYRSYFQRWVQQAALPKTMLDPAPRIALDPDWGLAAAGRSAAESLAAGELYRHAIDIMLASQNLGGFQALPERELFDVEYWDLEQAKLLRQRQPAPFAGEVALVTGAASGIGRACVDSLLARGAAVIGLDVNPDVGTLHARPDFLGLACDLTDEAALESALDRAVRAYGGIDMLVLNAGIFSAARKIKELPSAEWRRVMAINLDANLNLMRSCHALLQLAPAGGRVVIIGSKNVPAPGPGAAAYSASKAALNQLARVAALEWGADGIRINSLHPNAVFDTGIWTEEVLAQRARHYGLSVEQYKTNNVLKTEVRSTDVAELAAELCGRLFAKTTGAQIPVDGGNERVI